MAIYAVKNQWGGSSAPWHDGGSFVLGCRNDQNLVDINISSEDGGKSFSGTIIYEGEGPIGFKATQVAGTNYSVQNQWGGDSAPWHDGGNWIIGARTGQNVVSLQINSSDGGRTFNGTMVYAGEGPIGVDASMLNGSSYTIENQWGGDSAPWHLGGTMILGTRDNQNPVAFDISSTDEGKTFTGTMTYAGEGPIGFKAELTNANNYTTQNQWGGDDAPWHEGGVMILGCRDGQNNTKLSISSQDEGKSFSGDMQYVGEGPIGFKGAASSCDIRLS